MKRVIFGVVVACLTAFVSQAARQNATAGQRLHFKIGIPRGQQPKLLLPYRNTIELSALNMERDEASVMHLKGDAEIRFELSRSTLVLRVDEATYDVNAAEIQLLGNPRMSVERAR